MLAVLTISCLAIWCDVASGSVLPQGNQGSSLSQGSLGNAVPQGDDSLEGSARRLCPPMPRVPQPPERVNTTARLMRMRQEMRRNTIALGPPVDAYIVTTDDDHQSEYVAERDERLRYLSGFSGSAGVAVVTERHAALWTDGRYQLQADSELGCDWLLMGRGEVHSSIPEWLATVLRPGQRVGADPSLVSSAAWERWAKGLADRSLYLLPTRGNPVDAVWGTDRPNYTTHEAYVWSAQDYAGESWEQKLESVRKKMEEQDCDAMVVTALDEIAWLLNIRGHDIPYIPVVRAYVIVTKNQLMFYVPPNKLSPAVKRQLHTEECYSPFCARIHNYSTILEDLKTLSQVWKKVLLPAEDEFSQGVSRAIYTAIPVDKRHVTPSPITSMKSAKNMRESEGMRRAHIRDAVAFCDFMAYLEDKMKDGENWDELKVASVLDSFRKVQNLNRGLSFRTIVAFGPHAAWPHYTPTNVSSLPIDKSSILLIDSGGHYMDGTTDVSRTFHLGNPTEKEIDVYTRVLLGCIDLASLRFPHNLPVRSIDVLARAHMWRAGEDYVHGTGHGVGAFGAVHESPINIHWWSKDSKTFKVGYFVTEEPGFYQEGQFGVRLENVMEVVESNLSNSNGHFLAFRMATLVPFEPKLIDFSRFSPQQVQWLNEYNKRIMEEVGAEMKRQYKMMGYHWVSSRAKNYPLTPVNCPDSALELRSSLLFCLPFLVLSCFSWIV